MRGLLLTGAGALLALLIMTIGSFVMWIGTPLLWLWLGSQVQGSTGSLGTALLAMFAGSVVTVWLLAVILSRLSEVHRAHRLARGHRDPGHEVLERVLVTSAGLSIVGFAVWFFLFAGANPVPLGIQL